MVLSAFYICDSARDKLFFNTARSPHHANDFLLYLGCSRIVVSGSIVGGALDLLSVINDGSNHPVLWMHLGRTHPIDLFFQNRK